MQDTDPGRTAAAFLSGCQYAHIAGMHTDQPWNAPVDVVRDASAGGGAG